MKSTMMWRVSSFSLPNNDCVEVGRGPGETLIRDTKNRSAGALHLTPHSLAALLHSVKRG
ncbi:uncharacterized protein DUF397 [Actinokineospora auranticolor]|uniref:Uncharacterized protein DUF397 n=1 Tax=Actinokineospora auranticolor TaxID=155976 RepID=A0A2S6GHU4_9PSEU|nr:DUF397 domain-containing protein [Actinokineospora auranticolor]PPK64763.1 uncharacterized protein DUF397 [Actinokineospora auranticolor]